MAYFTPSNELLRRYMDKLYAKDKLTFDDYISMPIQFLVTHPDFQQHAFRVATRIMTMTTEELVALDLLKGK